MAKEAYVEKNFKDATLDIIRSAERILTAYAAQGYRLTLRQLYYQFVARDLLPDSWVDPATNSKNNMRSYKKLGGVINDARVAGLLDWQHIEDRTRGVTDLGHWRSPADIMQAARDSFRIDKWGRQPNRVLVLFEKDALEGVIQPVCQRLDVPYLSTRGYLSQSTAYDLAQRIRGYIQRDQDVVILHLADHDPSGVNMTEDLRNRLEMFGVDAYVDRQALNMAQVEAFNPPPNPAKETDSRFVRYEELFGDESWELDALPPEELDRIITGAVEELRDDALWYAAVEEENSHLETLAAASTRWEDVERFLRKGNR